MAMAEYLLILTATVTPQEGVNIARRDPEQRLADYMRALSYWLSYEHPKTRQILFLENSGADLAPLKRIVAEQNRMAKQVEFLSIPGSPIPEGVSYGFGEMEMVDAGLSQSELASHATHLIKVTGRLKFPRLGKLLDVLPTDLQLAVDCRIRGSLMFASSQLTICSREFYESNLRGVCYELSSSDSPYIEELLFSTLIRFRNKPGVILRWPFNVDPVGVAGHANKTYRSPSKILASLFREVVRRIAPWYWM
jgi:hypothetical protein